MSRVDTEIDKRLDAARHRRGQGRSRGKAGARQRPARLPGVRGGLLRATAGPPWTRRGANKQRPLWASTGVKDPAYKDTLYVDELVAPGHGQHHAGGHPGRRRRPRRDHRRHRRRHLRAGPRRPRRASRRSASPTTRSSSCWRTRASRSSRRPGTTCSSPPRRSSSASPLRRAEHLDCDPGANPLRDPAGPTAPADRGAVRPGHLRRHGRPVPQEADARRLRPRQPRPAAAGLLARRLRPPRLGGRGLRAGRPRRGQGARPHAVPRGGLAAARPGHALRPGQLRRRRRRSRRCSATIEELDKAQGTGGNFAFYLSVPPKFFPKVVQQLKKHGLADQPEGSWRRAVIEKPFGHDLASARGAQRGSCTRSSRPDEVFRIDHYLGKETVQNILALRFANTMFEPIWNRSLRRPRADHDGRGHRHRRPGRLLRRHRRRP